MRPKIAPQAKPLIYIFFFFFGVQKGNKRYKIEIERALIIYNSLQCINTQNIMPLAISDFSSTPRFCTPRQKESKMLWNPETLPHYFRYDPATGYLYWKQKRRGRNCNKPAGSINKLTKCVIISCIGMQLFAHDIVWAYVTGKYSKAPIRHKNGNRWDNRFENLYEGMADPAGTLLAPSLLSNGTIEKHLRYDKETGQLFWKEPRQGRSLKLPAGHFSSATGGRIVSINTFPFKAEYLIWLLENDGQKPLGTIRHRDGKKYNNRIENLYDDFFDFL